MTERELLERIKRGDLPEGMQHRGKWMWFLGEEPVTRAVNGLMKKRILYIEHRAQVYEWRA